MLRVIVALLLLATGTAAQRVEPSVRDWLRQNRLLLTPDEEKVLGRLQPGDLEAFVHIFWARRDPDPATPDNPARAAADRARADADARFSDAGVRGSETACGQVLVLLGNPDEVTGRELRNTFDTRPAPSSRYRLPEQASRNATRDGARRPELWTYKSTPARTFRMPGGDLKLQFDDGCEFEESGRTLDELARVAAERVLHPEIAYEFGADGHLRPGAAATRDASPTRAPFDRPASDFALSFEPVIQVPAQHGAYTAGIVRAGPDSLPPPPGGLLRLTVASRATPAGGAAVAGDQRTVVAAVEPDGSFVTSFGFTLPAGRHEVEVAVLDPASGKGAMAKVPVEVPDYAGKAMVVSPLAVLAGLEDAGTTSAEPDPYEAFAIGSQRLRPRAGNGLLRTDSLRLLVLVHNAPLDPATGKAAVKVSFSVLQGGKPIARGADQQFDTTGAVPMVGPISLAPFAAGSYLARVEVADGVGKAVVVRETPFLVRDVPFEVREPGPPPQPPITAPVMFDTPEADRILAALQVFPPDNPWNQDISTLPVHPDSARIIAGIGADKPLRHNLDMGFIIVPPDQPRVPVQLLDYPAESDPGPYPVPDNAPIENWPMHLNEDVEALPKAGQTLEQLQREGTGDRHVIVVDPVNGKLYEFWQARKTDAGWQASNNATFDLRTGALRPERWTSADAAGLPIFPAVVRYDECERGMVRHAMRFTVRRTRRAYVLPATHWASRETDPSLPRMGERFRLRKDFDVSGFPPHAQAILKGLKQYGMFVADNGSDWFMSIAPDRRLKGLETLSRVKGSDFEVVDTGARSVEGK